MDIDVDALIGGTAREVVQGERDGVTTRVVRATRELDTTVEDLWECVSDPERLPRWFLPVTGELRVGGRFQIEGNAGGTVLECDPPEHLAVTWESNGGVSWLDVRLTPVDGGRARLELSHTVPTDAHWDQFGPGAVGMGWELALMGLVLHTTTGDAVDGDEVMAWQASPAGLDLMRRSGAGWCEAHIAGGDPADEARAMADRCVAAYTGG
ncbi:MAG TPA: SRPBCC family protein [Acidimicrobiales bacterium]|nr:SRPBCC family protein [Acidimicrobiales bacterium]